MSVQMLWNGDQTALLTLNCSEVRNTWPQGLQIRDSELVLGEVIASRRGMGVGGASCNVPACVCVRVHT